MLTDKKCSQCGSTDIVCQGLAKWDVRQQEWVFDLKVDAEYCYDCGSFDIIDVEVEDEEIETDA